jgi:predicted phosphodiesterase
MKIQILSDVHSELLARYDNLSLPSGSKYRQWNGTIPDTDADVIVLAGDINIGARGVEWAIQESDRLQKPIIYVAGNHEFYNREYHSTLKQMRDTTNGTNVHFLECDELVINDVRFLGTTLWTNYDVVESISRNTAMKVCEGALNDHKLIRISPDGLFTARHALSIHTESVQWLKKRLTSSNIVKKTVVVTHHGPSNACQHKRFPVDAIAASFYSDLEELIGKADAWIYGHTHSNLDTVINGCRLISNQPGYPREYVDDFAADKIIEI